MALRSNVVFDFCHAPLAGLQEMKSKTEFFPFDFPVHGVFNLQVESDEAQPVFIPRTRLTLTCGHGQPLLGRVLTASSALQLRQTGSTAVGIRRTFK